MDLVTNLYERFVYSYLTEDGVPIAKITDDDLLKDITCLALNILPPRYIPHEVDMDFFLSDDERELIQAKVRQAVDIAIEIAIDNPRKPREIMRALARF